MADFDVGKLMVAGIISVVRSVLFYVVFYGGSFLYVSAGILVLPCSLPGYIRIADSWSRFHRSCVAHLLGIRVRLQGRLPEKQAIIAIKHESFFEAIDLPNLLNYPVVFAKIELINMPMWGRLAAAYGVVPVARDQGAKTLRSMIRAARNLTEQGRVLAIFPEGTRVPHGRIAPLQSGFAGLYKLMDMPVVPVAVDSGPLYHRMWKRSGTITYRVGPQIPPGLPREELEVLVLEAINVLNVHADHAKET